MVVVVVNMSPPKEATSAPQTRVTSSSCTKRLPILYVARSIGSRCAKIGLKVGHFELQRPF